MFLAIDVGNSETVLGLYFGEDLDGRWRLTTRRQQTVDEYGLLLSALMDTAGHRLSEIESVCLASVVPEATVALTDLFRDRLEIELVVVDHQTKTGLKIRYAHPESIGADRIANAVGGRTLFGGPLLIVDFGTATTIDVVLKSGVYAGGLIAPGVQTGADALIQSAAKLSGVVLEAPARVVGSNTEESLKSGLVFGAAAMVDGLLERIKSELRIDCPVVATGGLAGKIASHCRLIDQVEPLLTILGLRRIWELSVSEDS